MNPCFCVQQANPRRGDFVTSPITVTNNTNKDLWVTILSHNANDGFGNKYYGRKYSDRHRVLAGGNRQFEFIEDPSRWETALMDPIWYDYYITLQALDGTVLLEKRKINPVDVTIDTSLAYNITQPKPYWEE